MEQRVRDAQRARQRAGLPPAALATEILGAGSVLEPVSDQVRKAIQSLVEDYCEQANVNRRKGGLLGLSSVAIALGHQPAQLYVSQLVPPVLTCFSDEDPVVRYAACEAFYNIAKVARHSILEKHLGAVFDGLCRLYADVDATVKEGAQFLDRLIRDIVTETKDFTFFKFIPMLSMRIRVLNPSLLQLVLGWLSLLDSVPQVDMITYLPQFLEGLFNILRSDNRDIRHNAQVCLNELLKEIKAGPPMRAERAIADTAQIVARCCRAGEWRSEEDFVRLSALDWLLEFVMLQVQLDGLAEENGASPGGALRHHRSASLGDGGPGAGRAESPGFANQRKGSTRRNSVGATPAADGKPPPGGFRQLLPILLSGALHCMDDDSLYRNEESEFQKDVELADMQLKRTSKRLGVHLPVEAVVDTLLDVMQDHLRRGTGRERSSRDEGIAPVPAARPSREEVLQSAGEFHRARLGQVADPQRAKEQEKTSQPSRLPTRTRDAESRSERSKAVLMKCFEWAQILFDQCPERVLRSAVRNRLMEAALAALQRSEDEVALAALQLICDLMTPGQDRTSQVDSVNDGCVDMSTSPTRTEDLFTTTCHKLFSIIGSQEASALAGRSELIVRRVCEGAHHASTLVRRPEGAADRFFTTAARAVSEEEDLAFSQRLVRVLNRVLLTSRETQAFRRRLREEALEAARPGDGSGGEVPKHLLDLLTSWFHCPVSTLGLCLWLHWFEMADVVTSRLARMELSPSMSQQLLDLDELLESPIFMRVRMQLLHSRQQPALLRAVIGLATLLPKQTALKARLEFVQTALMLERTGRTSLVTAPQQSSAGPLLWGLGYVAGIGVPLATTSGLTGATARALERFDAIAACHRARVPEMRFRA